MATAVVHTVWSQNHFEYGSAELFWSTTTAKAFAIWHLRHQLSWPHTTSARGKGSTDKPSFSHLMHLA